MKKGWKNGVPILSANRTPALLGTYRPQKSMKLSEVVVPAKISIACQKIERKSIYKGPRAVAFILAFIVISEA